MSSVLVAIKLGCLAACMLGCTVAGYGMLSRQDSFVRRVHPLYVAYLNRRLHRMLMAPGGQRIVGLQLMGIAVLAFISAALADARPLMLAAVVIATPTLVLRILHTRRVARIDEQVDSFLLTLANALRATPSLGSALAHTEHLLAPPLSRELSVTLQELRVGSSLDQALLNMSARVRSVTLDSGVSALLIGRQVGGDLSQVLETTAATLRELRRLQGVLKTKTAEARAQMWALAVIPPLLVWGLERVKTGYFTPLFEAFVGQVVFAAAVVLWALSLVVSRQILKVEL